MAVLTVLNASSNNDFDISNLAKSSALDKRYFKEELSILSPDNDDDVYLKKITTRDVTKSNSTKKYRPAKGISKRVDIQITKDFSPTRDSIADFAAAFMASDKP
jgi:hypothetical protein